MSDYQIWRKQALARPDVAAEHIINLESEIAHLTRLVWMADALAGAGAEADISWHKDKFSTETFKKMIVFWREVEAYKALRGKDARN